MGSGPGPGARCSSSASSREGRDPLLGPEVLQDGGCKDLPEHCDHLEPKCKRLPERAGRDTSVAVEDFQGELEDPDEPMVPGMNEAWELSPAGQVCNTHPSERPQRAEASRSG